MPDHELPASVRAALWGTEVLRGRLPARDLPRRALPDVDATFGLVEQVRLWRDLGERTLLVALPRPGDLAGMPQGSPDLLAAATRAEECLFVPALGGALVPELETFGPAGDRGWRATWTAHPAAPVPTHRVEALDLGQTELRLRQDLAALTEELVSAGAPPFGAVADRSGARAREAGRGTAVWGLPDRVPPRTLRVVQLAGTVLAMADAGLESAPHSVDTVSVVRRDEVLRRLRSLASRALAEATNAAALHLGYRA
ncbi:hypothetical protein [Ornithinimicrobium avium]|uniref:Uncharacterized protein n=1 Tax=Ornithinimicrobium avium TaxID=2283195 RepID=A0A345NJG2_9MICO|nr:hypothetical protein [Ornithinimicrobium avium]AXH95170.1 hypothetical protein DV701_02505 [Ornithinimicrobium avium]